VAPILPVRTIAQRVIDVGVRGRLADALEIARTEQVELTTPQPDQGVPATPSDRADHL
jgi:hypothetical protein